MFIQFPLAEIIFPNLYVAAMNIIVYIIQQGRGKKNPKHPQDENRRVLGDIKYRVE